MKWHYKLFLSFLLVTATITGWSQKIPPAPNPPKLVNDLAGVLSASEVQQLEAHLLSYNDTTSNQVAVVLIKTLDGYPIEEYANKLLREWGIGNKDKNNGVLILAAMDDRAIRIEVGYGLEGAIPDIIANHIIEEDIKPNFRSGDYYEGLKAAADHIIDAAKGEYKGTPNRRRSSGRGGLPIGLIIFAIIMIIVFSGRNRGGGGGFMSRRGSGWLGPLILGSMLGRGSSGGGWGGGGGGGWSGGGGGFGGFGGGSSGGGGASGSW
jgi:uncharacterized protein